MAQAPEHPLLSLPDEQIIQKLRKMSVIEILKFSLLSERCKELVASCKIQGSSFHVTIARDITIFIKARIEEIEVSFYTEPGMYWGMGEYGEKKKLTVPQSVKVYEYNFIYPSYTASIWENNTLTMQYWLNHLQYIFNYPKIDRIWFSDDSFQFDIDDIKEVFGKTTKVKIGSTGCFSFNQMVLQKFSSLEKLSIKASSFPNSKVPESALIQNFDELHVGGIMEITSMTLDDLLLINSKIVIVENHQMPKKLLNNFIKLWQKGSNPRMEYLCTFYLNSEEDDKEFIMEGIKHDVIPDNRRRNFKSVGLTDTSPVTGGIDIYRMDGTKATIQIKNGLTFFIVRILQFPSAVMAAIPKFPLLGLPADEIRRTIRVMDLEQILRFSFLSKRCKSLVAGIQIKRMYFSVFISRSIAVIIHFTGSRFIRLEFYTEPDMYWGTGTYGRKKKLTVPQSVKVSHNGPIGFDIESSIWERNELTMQYWLKHLQDIFNYHGIHSIKFSTDSSQFDIDDIKQVFDSTKEIDIGNTGCVEFNQMVLRNYFPIDDLTIWTDDFRDSKIPPSLLMQNRVKLEITDSDLDVPITLNDLLLINSKVIIVRNLLSPQQLPKDFITLWQKGSNPDLEYFCVEFSDDEENDGQYFMSGIKYEVNPVDQVRNFKSVGFENPIEISGGMDIYRFDGVKATIKIEYEYTFPGVEMYVWFDHCVVEP